MLLISWHQPVGEVLKFLKIISLQLGFEAEIKLRHL